MNRLTVLLVFLLVVPMHVIVPADAQSVANGGFEVAFGEVSAHVMEARAASGFYRAQSQNAFISTGTVSLQLFDTAHAGLARL